MLQSEEDMKKKEELELIVERAQVRLPPRIPALKVLLGVLCVALALPRLFGAVPTQRCP